MGAEDEYEVFLDSWAPNKRLELALLDQYLHDEHTRGLALSDTTGEAELERTPYASGPKAISSEEIVERGFTFFQEHQDRWSRHFRDYVLSKGLPEEKYNNYVSNFTRLWVDGKSRRQNSPEMKAIKASIRDHDRKFYRSTAARFVIHPVEDNVTSLFTVPEMEIIFTANSNLIDTFMPEYLESIADTGPTSINQIYVRRGVLMPCLQTVRRELHELSSYSLGTGAVEQFAQIWTEATKGSGVPLIFSAPLPAVQTRIVAFAPFITGMDLSQLELVVAPPVNETRLFNCGSHGGISELMFD